MTQESFKTTVLRPSANHYLTQAGDVDIEERMIASVVALGRGDSIENYKEIDQAEADEIREAQAEARQQEKANDND